MSSYLDQNGLSRVISKIKDSLSSKLDKSGGTISGNLAVNGQFTNGGKTIETIVDEKLASFGQIFMSSIEHIVGYLDSYPIYERTFYGKNTTSNSRLIVELSIGSNLNIIEIFGNLSGVPISYGIEYVSSGASTKGLWILPYKDTSVTIALYPLNASFAAGVAYPYAITVRYIKL